MPVLPQSTKALVIDGKSVRVEDVALPALKNDEVAVHVSCVAINPTDYKHVDFQLGTEGALVGCEAAGKVVAVGSSVKNTKVGDLVAVIISGASATNPQYGAFSEYAVAQAKGVFKFPGVEDGAQQGHILPGPVTTLEQAVSFPVGFTTAAIGLNYYAGLALRPNSSHHNQIFLVWGGASALGQSVVQLAKYLGFKVFATCSPDNSDWVKDFGADETFNYHDRDVVEQIQRAAGDNITYAFDAITTGDTTKLTNQLVSKTRPVTVFTSLDFNPEQLGPEKKDNVKFYSPLAYLVLDKIKKFGSFREVESPKGLIEQSEKFLERINEIIADQPTLFKAMPIEVLTGGFAGVEKGLDIVRKGMNRGKKIVVRL